MSKLESLGTCTSYEVYVPNDEIGRVIILLRGNDSKEHHIVIDNR